MVWHVGIAQYRGQQPNVQVAQVCMSKAGYWEAPGAAAPGSEQQWALLGGMEPAWRSQGVGRGLGSQQLRPYLPPQQKVTSAKVPPDPGCRRGQWLRPHTPSLLPRAAVPPAPGPGAGGRMSKNISRGPSLHTPAYSDKGLNQRLKWKGNTACKLDAITWVFLLFSECFIANI